MNPNLRPGSAVEVFSFGSWYAAEVVRLTPTKVLARYTTGSGATREKTFPHARVRTPTGNVGRRGDAPDESAGAAPKMVPSPPPPAPVVKLAPKAKAGFATREEWLNALSAKLAPLFKAVGAPLPGKVRITVSLTGRSKVVGLCYSAEASTDKHFEILVRIDQDDPFVVAGILVHELIHAAVGLDAGHKGPFRKAHKALGLIGSTKTCEVGPELRAKLEPILASVGTFPHAALRFARNSGPKKQGTRMIKCVCEECGFLVRTTGKWITEVGAPHCPAHGEMAVDGDD